MHHTHGASSGFRRRRVKLKLHLKGIIVLVEYVDVSLIIVIEKESIIKQLQREGER